MDEAKVLRTVCGLCTGNCGVLITMQDGKAIKIQGDPECMVNKGELCIIGRSSLEYLYHPDRLKHPLKKVGARGGGKWQKITWDEAFSLTAEAFNKAKNQYGPEHLVVIHGSAKGLKDTHLVRLANAFDTPNVVTADHVCHVPRMLGGEFTFGFFPASEFDPPPTCIIAWGVNHAQTRFYKNKAWRQAQSEGTKLIVIDPLKTAPAKGADVWLQLRPGTDLALALGIIYVMIDEKLYDKTFVEKWTIGFDKLQDHIQAYPPDKVSEITWVPADMIAEAARLYAKHRPTYIELGNALDHTSNSFQTCRAISILIALKGDLDIPGGDVLSHASGFRYGDTGSTAIGIRGRWSFELELRDKIPLEKRKNRVNANLLPDFRYVSPQSVLKSILEGDPYRIRIGLVQGSNPLSSWPNIEKTLLALNKLDFLAVSDMFMTPTAALADVVFPAASYLEFDGIQIPPPPGSAIAQYQRKIAQIGECLSDHDIINGLAKKLGLGEYFWGSIEDFWNYVLEPIGITFVEFKNIGKITIEKENKRYKKYEKEGFRTPSGMVEFYSEQLEALGFQPLPIYLEPPETVHSEPNIEQEYPLICTTRKLAGYRHSGGRQITDLRRFHPDPTAILHPYTANRYGIRDGEWIYIESNTGKIRQKAKLLDVVNPRVILADHAWWFPERGANDFYGWAESNYNGLTNDKAASAPEVGSFNIRGLACRISKTA